MALQSYYVSVTPLSGQRSRLPYQMRVHARGPADAAKKAIAKVETLLAKQSRSFVVEAWEVTLRRVV